MRIFSITGSIALLFTLSIGCEKSDRGEIEIDTAKSGKKIVSQSNRRTVVVHIEGFKKSKSGAT